MFIAREIASGDWVRTRKCLTTLLNDIVDQRCQQDLVVISPSRHESTGEATHKIIADGSDPDKPVMLFMFRED